MASGDTLLQLGALDFIPSSTNGPQFKTKNGLDLTHVLAFDTATQETATSRPVLLPRGYSGGGVTVYVEAAAESTSGTLGWTVAFERIATTQDVSTSGFASAQTVTAATVANALVVPINSNVGFTDGAQMDSWAAGEWGRVQIKRDVSNDNMSADGLLIGIEVKET